MPEERAAEIPEEAGAGKETLADGAESACQVDFYHLTRTALEEALPALLRRTLSVGQRAVLRCRSATERDHLDKILWESPAVAWLPHGTEKTGFAERQPVWLTVGDDVPNQARFLFRADGAGSDDFSGFERVFDLFDGRDEASVSRARLRWKAAKQAGCKLTYWKQGTKTWQQAG